MKRKQEAERELPRYCRFCQHATELAGGETMLCQKKGVVSAEYQCGRFTYDILKREPKRVTKDVRLEYVEL